MDLKAFKNSLITHASNRPAAAEPMHGFARILRDLSRTEPCARRLRSTTLPTTLLEDVFDDAASDVGQPMMAALVLEGQPLVIDSEQMQHGGMEVVDVNRRVDDVVGEVIGLAITY